MSAQKIVKPTKVITTGVIATAVIAGLLLVVANSAVWINQTIFDSTKFSEVTTQSLLSESSRRAVASEVVDQALADKPIIRRVVGGTAVNMISGLLASQPAQGALDKAVTSIQLFVTSKNPRNIEFDIAGIKSISSRILGIIGNEEASDSITNLPDTLVVVDASKVPNIYPVVVVFLWLGPLCFLIALFLLALPHIRRKKIILKVVLFQGVIILSSALFALVLGPLFRPPFLAQIADPNYRIVAQNLYDAFTGTFTVQTLWLVSVGLVLALVPLGVWIAGIMLKRVSRLSRK